eukprot:211871_1
MALRLLCQRLKRHIYCRKIFPGARLLHNRMITCRYGFDIQQSKRSETQDAIYHSSNFNINNKQYCLFGVFDGHGQDLCAKFLANNIEIYLSKNLQKYPNSVNDAFKITMHEMDVDFNRSNVAYKYTSIGSTACIALVDKNVGNNPVIHVSNVGDSRCVLVDNISNEFNITALTSDHHPKVNEYEKQRLLQLNHRKITPESIFDEYFGLSLAMSRCIGNEYLKKKNKNVYISQPDVITYEINDLNEYLLLYSDGFTFKHNDIQNIFNLIHNNKYELTNEDLNNLSYRLTSYVVNGTINDGFDENIGQYYMELSNYFDDDIYKNTFNEIYKYFSSDDMQTEKNIKTIGRLIKICVFNFDDDRRFKIMEELLFPYAFEDDMFDLVKYQFCYENIMNKIKQLNEKDKIKFNSFIEWLNEAKQCKGSKSIDDVSLIIVKLDE